VDFDAGHLHAGKLPANVDIVNLVARDGAEDGSQGSHDSGLFTIMNVIVPNDVAPNIFF
jgi:hypothetical protein